MNTYILAVSTALLFSTPAVAGSHGHGPDHKMPASGHAKKHMEGMTIMIKHPWARASIGRNGAAFATIINGGKTDDSLVGVRSKIAKRAELHTHKMDGNIMRMRPIDSIPIPAGKTVTLQPSGYHVMLLGLSRKLKEGAEFLLTLKFEKADDMQVRVRVKKMGAMGPMQDQGGHKMKH